MTVDPSPSTRPATPLTTAQLVARARAVAARDGRTILGITGAPGAGKSTLARTIVEALGPRLAVEVGMDGFHLSNAVLEELGRRDRKGAIDTFDDAGYAALVARLGDARAGDPPVYAPVFRREIEEPIAAGVAVPGDVPLVVTEGNYLLATSGAWPDARARMAEIWYLEVPDDVRLARLEERHHAFGKSRDDARRWARGSDQANADLIVTTRDAADLVVGWSG
ncbi:nucleoside/nucleotide kinase family protein [Isoptericola variabilis]|uniref:Fructose transport system kinase n=1 Tax=Isoptericola variabilis (strain 225) TaxID=743718 RepID=F6FUP9_ISOV2|nr:nucleoside/nucleotide kinase family protein [Isoptericola variabilis]AEG43310.1 fructose transport system kinase [Isoptericola variabilis 225]TWH35245.1 pantothenate kinase [Isoptericola variabilis J7]